MILNNSKKQWIMFALLISELEIHNKIVILTILFLEELKSQLKIFNYVTIEDSKFLFLRQKFDLKNSYKKLEQYNRKYKVLLYLFYNL